MLGGFDDNLGTLLLFLLLAGIDDRRDNLGTLLLFLLLLGRDGVGW